MLTVDVTHWVDVLDDGVHEGLREGGLIKLVMTHLTVADEVDNDVSSELLAVLGRNAESISDIVHRLSIDVEDRGADSRGDFGTVGA